MKIVIVGYGKLFREVLEGCLCSGNDIVGVLRVNRVRHSFVTNFFKDTFFPDEDKLFVKMHNLYDIDVPSVNSEKFREILVRLNPDIVFVSSWCEKFSIETIKIPKIGTINLHPSLLPKYRGPNPYAQVIKCGEKETGLTFHLMDSNYDSGAILRQKKVNISENETGESLRNKCSLYVREETIQLLKDFEQGFITPIEQNNTHSTYYRQLDLSDSVLPFLLETSVELDRRIRALTPWLKSSVPCGNEFFMFKDYRILEEKTKTRQPAVLFNDGENVVISTVDNKAIEFLGVYPVRYIPKFLHKWYVKKYLKVWSSPT